MSQFPNANQSNSSAPSGSGQLVVIGLVVAVIAVVLMNVYVEMRVKASQEDTVTYFRYEDEMKVGDEIQMSDLESFEIPKSLQKAFGTNAVPEDPQAPGRPLDGEFSTLNESVVKGQMLMFSHFRANDSAAMRDPAYRNLDEITLNIDSKEQPPNLRPGDFIDLYASINLNRTTRHLRIMEYVRVKDLGERTQEGGASSNRSSKYGSITIYVDPSLSGKLYDIQDRVVGQTFNVTRRDPQDKLPRELDTGGSKEINKRVLEILNLE